jgi:DNA repair ATPase RecN
MRDILSKIDSFNIEENSWNELDIHITDLMNTENSEKGIVNLFKILERYHDRDDHVLWEIGHATEDMKGFEYELVNSLKRQPSDIGIMLLNMIYNTGAKEIGGENMDALLAHLKNHPKSSSSMVSYITEAFEEW